MKTIIEFVITMSLVAEIVMAQDITFVASKTSITDTLGKEIVFDLKVANISSSVQTIFIVRTANNLPPDWSSSLCFGNNCYAPFQDSIATTAEFANSSMQPGEQRDASIHVSTLNNSGTASVTLAAGTIRNPGQRIEVNFTASTILTRLDDISPEGIPQTFCLGQNYPNPFNSMTIVDFRLPIAGYVRLSIFDILGREVTVFVNEKKDAGNYSVRWNASGLSSGVYFYSLHTGEYHDTKRMVLMK